MKKIISVIAMLFSILFVSCSGSVKVYSPPVINKFNELNNSDNFIRKPVSVLPEGISAPDSTLTLFADYKNIYKNSILLYVINKTGKKIKFPSDGRLYIKQEMLNEAGNWERAESHSYSFCGNSYGIITLNHDEYIICPGYCPEEGEKSRIRYKFYDGINEAVSNDGVGFYNEDRYDQAKFDAMAIRDGSFDFLSGIVLNQIDLPDDKYLYFDIRSAAISCLVKFSDDKTFELINNILFNFSSVSEIQKEYLILGFRQWKDDRKLGILFKILSDSATSPDYFSSTLTSLCWCSKEAAKDYIKKNLEIESTPKRSMILNQLAVEFENDYFDYKRREQWEADSASIKLLKNILYVPGSDTEETAEKYRNPPRADLFWYSDTTLFNYLNSIKYNFYDPLILRILSTISTYRKDDLHEYLKSISNNKSLPDSITGYARDLFEGYFSNNVFGVSCDFDRRACINSGYSVLPVKVQILNSSEQDINITGNEIRKGIDIEIVFNATKTVKYSSKELKFRQDSTWVLLSDNYTIPKSKSIFFWIDIPIDPAILKNKPSNELNNGIDISFKLNLFIERLYELPARVHSLPTL